MWLYSLEHSLQQIQSHLTPLITPETLARLQSVSRCFPDALSNTFGFEYRLSPASSTVDFAVLVSRAGGEILAGTHPTIRLGQKFDAHPIWQTIQTFCQAWSDPSHPLHDHIPDLWLEFDLEDTAAQPGSSVAETVPVPGLLFRTEVAATDDGSPDYDWIVEQALPLLWGAALPAGLKTNLLNSLLAIPQGCQAFQIGVMLTRSVEAVRLCVVGAPSQLMSYLLEIGWTGEIAAVEVIVQDLAPYVEGICLSLDVGEQIYPRLGIEGYYLSRYLPCINGQWRSLLTHLVDKELCPPQTQRSLLRYSGYSTATILQPRHYVRGLNHLKLVYQPGKPLASKVYFGVIHQPADSLVERKQVMDQRAPAPLTQPIPTTSEQETSSIAQSIHSALTFLLNARDSQGWWKDFHLAPGTSDEWVTGYVGTMLAQVPDDRTSQAMQTAWSLLQTRRHRSTALWGYNLFPPGDADSTGWVLQLAAALGDTNSVRVQQARRSLWVHQQSDGGFSTYSDPAPIRAFINAPATLNLEGWCGSQVCVSAAIAALPEFRSSLLPYLHATQSEEGGWLAYWWHDAEYATALAAEAIASIDPDSERITQAVNWALRRLTPEGCVTTSDHPNGSPFATAWCVRLLRLRQTDSTVKDAIAQSVQWLLQQQQPDGSWLSSARLRVPYPNDLHPERADTWIYHGLIEGSLVFDLQRVFTTATVLAILSKVLYSDPESSILSKNQEYVVNIH